MLPARRLEVLAIPILDLRRHRGLHVHPVDVGVRVLAESAGTELDGGAGPIDRGAAGSAEARGTLAVGVVAEGLVARRLVVARVADAGVALEREDCALASE